MLLIQIFLGLFFLFAITRVAIRFRQGDLKVGGLIFWFLFWIAGFFVVIFPDSTFVVSKMVGITRGADLVVYVSLALLFFLVFKISVRQERIEKNITKIVREKTLQEKSK